jgi:hypothetical protein
MDLPPQGEERQIQREVSAAIDGAPISYIVVLAAVTTALSFIPFSLVLGTGGSMPLRQGTSALLGWLLGPIAGALANGMGTLIGVFLAPHTAGVPVVSVAGAALAGFTAGAMVPGSRRDRWYLGLVILFWVNLLLYGRQALQNGIGLDIFLAGSVIDWSGLLLFMLPTRTLCARWIGSPNLAVVARGLFLGTWIVSGVSHLSSATVTYFLYNWPKEVWIALIPIIPGENLIRCIAGTVIGTGVISGLRAINLVKPREGIY